MISDFDFYQTEYYGKLLSAEEFPEYATRADAWLSELTFDRYSSPDLSESQLQAVKKAECAVADLWYQLQTEQASNPAIQPFRDLPHRYGGSIQLGSTDL